MNVLYQYTTAKTQQIKQESEKKVNDKIDL